MTSKRSKAAAAADEIDELFEGLETTAPKKPGKGKGGGAAKKGAASHSEKDILAELENELEDKPVSRPHTPRIKELSAASATGKASPARRPPAATPSPDTAALPRRSAESGQSAGDKPAAAAAAAGGGGGGWWGGLISTASAAMKQAEAAVKEIQQNEEAKKWAEQVRGNVSALRGYGDELRHRALPAFTDILHTLAPPISSHEQLLIHITHDMVGYPSLDPLVHGVFSRVMAQVEGGDLLVIQRGHESAVRPASSSSPSGTTAGWRDGPWWRAVDGPRDMAAVAGLLEATKLCRASAEAYAAEYHAATGGLELARQRAVEPMSETNPVRRSDLFLAVQAILTTAESTSALFAGASSAKKPKQKEDSDDSDSDDSDEESSSDEEDEEDEEEDAAAADAVEDTICFAVYVLDPVHDIVYHTVSQAFPAKWIRWLDVPATLTPASSVDDGTAGGEAAFDRIPEEIRDIVDGGGVDPREWVAEWIEEALTLSVGIVAQRYVARRMGVGIGSIGKGKRPMDAVIADGGGEAARAGLI